MMDTKQDNKTDSGKAPSVSNEAIKAMMPTLSERPQVWFDKVRELIANGFTFKAETAEWIREATGERGRIAYTQEKAWLRHPTNV